MSHKNERRTVRSSSYQFLFTERCVPNELLDSFSDSDSVFKRLNPFSYNEEVLELEEQLRLEFWRVLKDNLTAKQFKMVSLLAEGKTQMETAQELDINQSSVTKNLKGSKEHAPNGTKVHGGIVKKIRTIIATDERINDILQQIANLRDDII